VTVGSERPVHVVLLWHHHQPDYRSPRTGSAVLPWVRLHATKDYLDMARRLERFPSVRAAFNFVPSLIDQIEAAAGGRDDLFDRLRVEPSSLGAAERSEVLARIRFAPAWAFERMPAYAALAHRESPEPDDAEFIALEAFFLLGWLDPMFHGESEAASALAARPLPGREHRDALLALHQRLTAEVIGAYRALEERGQIELSISPYHHPILPLLIDTRHALRSRPDDAMPLEPFTAPEDADEQVRAALDRHERAFGVRPRGMWPSEGSVSPEVASLMARRGVDWIASDEGVLWRSLSSGTTRRDAVYRPWKVETPDGEVAMLFRDHELSDLIGFVYARWNPFDAAANLMERLRQIGRDHRGDVPPLVTIILDGENCWEHYADDGGPFLDHLYTFLEHDPDVSTRTPSQAIAERSLEALPRLHSGSWIDSDFHIWIGHPEKNRAWDLLGLTRRLLKEAGATQATHPLAWESLGAAEGSDWFWWFGEDHFTPDRALFDRLFREHLCAACERAGVAVPQDLNVPIIRAARTVRPMQPLGFVTPVIDGRETSFYEWHEAGWIDRSAGGSMHREGGVLRRVHYGFDASAVYFRIDCDGPIPDAVEIDIVSPRRGRMSVSGLTTGNEEVLWWPEGGTSVRLDGAEAAADAVIEIALPFHALDLKPMDEFACVVHVMHEGRPVESLPEGDPLRFELKGQAIEGEMWSA
jgi:alpha-amylase/alpha-mannosidase (GH57 family)